MAMVYDVRAVVRNVHVHSLLDASSGAYLRFGSVAWTHGGWLSTVMWTWTWRWTPVLRCA